MKCQVCGKKEAIVFWAILKLCEDCYGKQKQREEEKELEAVK